MYQDSCVSVKFLPVTSNISDIVGRHSHYYVFRLLRSVQSFAGRGRAANFSPLVGELQNGLSSEFVAKGGFHSQGQLRRSRRTRRGSGMRSPSRSNRTLRATRVAYLLALRRINEAEVRCRAAAAQGNLDALAAILSAHESFKEASKQYGAALVADLECITLSVE
jgi:hypothetical protein